MGGATRLELKRARQSSCPSDLEVIAETPNNGRSRTPPKIRSWPMGPLWPTSPNAGCDNGSHMVGKSKPRRAAGTRTMLDVVRNLWRPPSAAQKVADVREVVAGRIVWGRNGLIERGRFGRSAWGRAAAPAGDQSSRPAPAPESVGRGRGNQVRVSSATAFLAQRSSTRPLPSAAAAISAAVAALLSARGSPLA